MFRYNKFVSQSKILLKKVDVVLCMCHVIPEQTHKADEV